MTEGRDLCDDDEHVAYGDYPFRVIELCSGAGGMALGFAAAGFSLSAHVEADASAAATYALNFGRRGQHSDEWRRPRDMLRCHPDELASVLGLGRSASDSFDVLVAGLPCQAFARIGRSKLRSLRGDDDAFRTDPRAALYRRFLEYVEAVDPMAVVIENVPDIMNFGGHNVPEEICETLDAMGYRSAYTILNAAFFGVPQFRERLFLLAIRGDLGVDPEFPEPTHRVDLPKGYLGSRNVAMKHIPRQGSHFREIACPCGDLPEAVTVGEALSDLPEIREHLLTSPGLRSMGRVVADEVRYPESERAAISEYAALMRSWPPFGPRSSCNGHVVRMTRRDFQIFKEMPIGADYPSAVAIAEKMLKRKIKEWGRRHGRPDPETVESLRRETVPPYDPSKFPNKWWKLDPERPSRTLTAHMGKDTYSHIHHDSSQARTISVREAARLQSFPDGFVFAGQINDSFRQIGNAVPPLLAGAVAARLERTLRDALSKSRSQKRPMAA